MRGIRAELSRSATLRLLGAVVTVAFASVLVPLLGHQDLFTAVVAAAAVAALSAALLAAVTRTAARPAAVLLVHRDYPGPQQFRVADDPLLSGRPQPRAPGGSCSA